MQLIGKALRREEDDRLLKGMGQYADDITPDNCLYLKFLRSPYPSGRITDLEIEGAKEIEGVVAVYTSKDIEDLAGIGVNPIIKGAEQTHYPILAKDRVMAVGQPVAAVIATSLQTANDALEAIFLDVDSEETEDILFEKFPENIVFSQSWKSGEMLSDQNSVSIEIQHPRVAPSPMEPRSLTAFWDQTNESLKIWLGTQTPHRAKADLVCLLNLEDDKIHVIAKDVGGAFGMKASLYPEDILTAWAAKTLKHSIKWTSTRGEDLQAASHGRGIKSEGQLNFTENGIFTTLKASSTAPVGHWLTFSSTVPAWNSVRILPGPYDIQNIDLQTKGQVSHTAPVGIYRGAGRPEAAMLMERLVEKAAHALNMDPLEIRLKNFISPENLPHTSASGRKLDSGNYAEALTKLAEISDYNGLRERQTQLRAKGKFFGIGIACYVEPCGVGWETAEIKIMADGMVHAATGGSSQGHGRETAFKQIIADIMQVPMDHISLDHSDTSNTPTGIGALASRSTAIGGSALKLAAKELKEKWNQSPNPEHNVSIKYEADGEAWGYGAYLATVRIDPETGVMEIEDIFCVDDAGNLINPMMVEGQIMGGLAQGIGEAMLEQIVYDEDGQLVTGSLMDYALPRADDMPKNITIEKLTTPSPNNPLGAKGVGEAGTIGTPAAIMNAALDALKPLGVTDLSMPLTSEKIWHAITTANSEIV
ncbi:xanthine dehydrogenase family protein molybdopterin-binding subunit [Curvivirga sp.]|uniref:xanthine dehydrogenase family protein molybdopterin-binding subunit n=1 Tax=Curvivirga sp. TaxID=2856848 RepID=UPI003B5B8B62